MNPVLSCRVCHSDRLTLLFSLGDHWVNEFPATQGGGKHRCPIELVLCRTCTLVQQRYTAPQDFLYTRYYWYHSGTTNTMRRALADVVKCATAMVPLSKGDVVLDIGSNDGTLLRCYEGNVVKVGVEPAWNLAEVGRNGVDVFVNDFWSETAFLKSQMQWPHSHRAGGPPKAKIITAVGMFYDLDDPNAFVRDVARVLHPDGVFVAQLQCLKQTLELGDVGNFCHEHLEFYSLFSLRVLMNQCGLEVFDVEENDVNGGSYRLYIGHVGRVWPNQRVEDAQKKENEMALDDPATYSAFAAQLDVNRLQVRAFVRTAVAQGKSVWVYGASTKGNTILQWLGLDHLYITAAADKSIEKHGRYMVGGDVPIRSEEEFRAVRPDYALVLPYAFLDEFVKRESDWIKGGGKFIVPLPSFRVVP